MKKFWGWKWLNIWTLSWLVLSVIFALYGPRLVIESRIEQSANASVAILYPKSFIASVPMQYGFKVRACGEARFLAASSEDIRCIGCIHRFIPLSIHISNVVHFDDLLWCHICALCAKTAGETFKALVLFVSFNDDWFDGICLRWSIP